MTQQDREKWNARYQAGSHGGRVGASVFLQECLSATSSRSLVHKFSFQIPIAGDSQARPRALDVACGTGRNAIYLAQAGFDVQAVDISTAGLEQAEAKMQARAIELPSDRHPGIQWIEADLDDYGFNDAYFDLIILFRYKNVPLMPKLAAALKPGGYFICEQHLQSSEAVVGPTHANFRWGPGELPELLSSSALHIDFCFEGLIEDPDSKPAALARVVARKELAS